MTSVGIVGLGSIARRHVNNLRTCLPTATIFGVSASGRSQTSVEMDGIQLLPNLDKLLEVRPKLVIVASPATLHLAHSRLLIQAGIPVLVEKPLAATFEEALVFSALKKQYTSPIALGYCFRFLTALDKVRQILASGVLGRLLLVESHVGQYLPDWRDNKDYRDSVSARSELGGGVLLELSHELDYLHYLVGALKFEHGILRTSKLLELEVEALADLTLCTESGVPCTLHLDYLQKTPRRTCVITGVEARLEWDILQGHVYCMEPSRKEAIYRDKSRDSNEKYLAMLSHFIAHIDGVDYRGATVEDGVATMRLIHQIKSHATWGNPV